jgi:hypothetical protein
MYASAIVNADYFYLHITKLGEHKNVELNGP